MHPKYNEEWAKWGAGNAPKVMTRNTSVSVTADGAEKALANRMFHKFRKVQLAFRGYDHDHSGSIDRKEFRKIFEDVGFKLSDSEFEVLMQVRLSVTNSSGL